MLSPSTLPNLSAAHKDLSRAFDPAATTNATFWADAADRLLSYVWHLQPPLLKPKPINGPRHAPPPSNQWPNPSAPPPTSANLRLTYFAYSALGRFPWRETIEGESYWRHIYNTLTAWVTTKTPSLSLTNTLINSTIPAADPNNISAYEELAELARLGFKPPPFMTAPWYVPGAYPHHDPADTTLIKYRPRGRPPTLSQFISAKPGKFLTARYAAHLTTDEIAAIANQCRTDGLPPAIKIARTPEEIAAIYRNGPSSCMAGTKPIINTINAVHTYAAPDCGVAYLERNGKPTARTVIRLSNKTYTKIYGDSPTLAALLKKEGFTYAYDFSGYLKKPYIFEGLRLRAMHAKHRRPAYKKHEDAGEPVLIVPYIDGPHLGYYDPADDSLVLVSEEKNIPKGRATHTLAGGYSIHSIPAAQKLTVNTQYGVHIIRTESGGSGAIQAHDLNVSSLGRQEEYAAQLAADRAATEAKTQAEREASRAAQPKAADHARPTSRGTSGTYTTYF